jgi:hypothetical protein
MMATSYTDFLARKQRVWGGTGWDVQPEQINPQLFPFQRDLTRWSLRKGRAALFADAGLGKTAMQLEWARLTGKPTLILAPLAVASQTVREGQKFGIPVTYARSQADADLTGITITNYEMLRHFDPSAFGAVVLDECFAAGTLIDTPRGQKHIETIKIGDSIYNAAGVDVVSDVHRRPVEYAVRITVDGRPILSSPNHPYFTARGWVCAQDLQPGDSLVATAEAMRMVRGDVPEIHGTATAGITILQSVLLSEMADETARACGQGSQSHGSRETRGVSARMVGVGQSRGAGGVGSGAASQSTIRSRGSSEDIPHIEGDAPRTFRAWGQRTWFDEAASDLTGCTRTELGSGICFVVGETNSGLSHELQDRLSRSRAANCYRSGWVLPRIKASHRRKERRQARFTRVDRLEVLEPGHPDLERLRDADGQLYFYDLGGTRHPSFSIHGHLVHNSSILKSFSGKTRTALIEAFKDTPLRLCCTATPAPNDIAELANHAEFLGIMTRVELLSMFFVHDEDGWRLKRHAAKDFYRWLASWAMSVKHPRDLGYEQEGYDLLPLTIHGVIVPSNYQPPGQLFPMGLRGITERTTVRKSTIAARVKAAQDLVLSEPHEPWLLWCGLNDEGRASANALPGAVVVEGKDPIEQKEKALLGFAQGNPQVLVSKSSISGFGMNWQHCARMIFLGLGDSYEQYYQAIRRCWRFGQTRPVEVYVIVSDAETEIVDNVRRKEVQAAELSRELIANLIEFEQAEIGVRSGQIDYLPTLPMTIPAWLEVSHGCAS